MGLCNRFRTGLALAVGLASLVAAPDVLHAQAAPTAATPPTAPVDPEVSRLVASHSAERYEAVVAGQKLHAGGAMIAVDAPVSVVRRLITDYAHYQDVLPGFQKSRVLGQSAQGTDVYLQVPILHGAATLWAVTRFTAPTREGNGERIEGKKNGPANLDDLRATWHFYAVDDDHTILKLELLLVPRLPLPASLITSQLAESAEDAVRACRDRAETLANGPAQAARPTR
jgi:ribosome-associated toxin RatA of RatAB toxin-antitoxin module